MIRFELGACVRRVPSSEARGCARPDLGKYKGSLPNRSRDEVAVSLCCHDCKREHASQSIETGFAPFAKNARSTTSVSVLDQAGVRAESVRRRTSMKL